MPLTPSLSMSIFSSIRAVLEIVYPSVSATVHPTWMPSSILSFRSPISLRCVLWHRLNFLSGTLSVRLPGYPFPPFLIGSNHRNSPSHQCLLLSCSLLSKCNDPHCTLTLHCEHKTYMTLSKEKKKVSTEDILNDPRLVSEMESKKRENTEKKKSETMHRTRVVCFWIGAVGFPLFNPRETKHCVIYSIWHVDSVGLPYWAFTVAHDTFRGCCRPRYQNMRLEMMTWSCSDRWGSANLTCESW